MVKPIETEYDGHSFRSRVEARWAVFFNTIGLEYEYEIEGGFPIKGTIKASGNKNAALPCIAATLLTKEKVVLKNIPEIEDTGVMFEILKSFGASVKKIKSNSNADK